MLVVSQCVFLKDFVLSSKSGLFFRFRWKLWEVGTCWAGFPQRRPFLGGPASGLCAENFLSVHRPNLLSTLARPSQPAEQRIQALRWSPLHVCFQQFVISVWLLGILLVTPQTHPRWVVVSIGRGCLTMSWKWSICDTPTWIPCHSRSTTGY